VQQAMAVEKGNEVFGGKFQDLGRAAVARLRHPANRRAGGINMKCW
jgi:hypothetical protein